MDLFDQHRQRLESTTAPLAARMRPRNLDEFVGQDHIVGPGRLLRRAIQADQLSSLIFYGPPGTGKTTLARIIANTTRSHFISINAVLAGVKDIREAIATAQEQKGMYGHTTILFVDEVHRFNKAQQDALLPWVENGTVILIGATTENPYFEVNKALVSRSRIFQLKPLEPADLYRVAEQCITDPNRGYGALDLQLVPEALDHLVNVANGDARALLNALELAVETTRPDSDDCIRITLDVAEESIQQRAVLYDKEGDAHFDTIRAFIKSVRGSDPDAALYWLARMVYAGEDPRYIFRRLIILASEDIGLGDPQAVAVVMACAAAFDRVGIPEGRYPLAQATLYLATAAKSNSTMAFFDALAAVEREKEEEVPLHLRDANRDKHRFGDGQGYLYPHSYREHWVEQQYLPQTLQGRVFYQPSDQGYEQHIRQQVERRREAQLAALVDGIGVALPEVLTFSPTDPGVEQWLQRTLSQAGERLGEVRDRLFSLAALERHHRVLDLQARTGLLTWEAVRRVPEGGVYACVPNPTDAAALGEQAAALPELQRPQMLSATVLELTLDHQDRQRLQGVTFDRIIGRNVLMATVDKAATIQALAPWLEPGNGAIVLAETIPRHTQRLYQLTAPERFSKRLFKDLSKAEETIYTDQTDPMVNWQPEDLAPLFQSAGFTPKIEVKFTTTSLQITPKMLDQWFEPGQDKPSYGDRLSQQLSAKDLEKVRAIYTQELMGKIVAWQGAIAYILARPI
ncbi:MAG: AAA family ATPase [Leptolyngbyaceae bacterium]|nr:AAA family ATPase [Leptolyngbyaceae bacterium]